MNANTAAAVIGAATARFLAKRIKAHARRAIRADDTAEGAEAAPEEIIGRIVAKGVEDGVASPVVIDRLNTVGAKEIASAERSEERARKTAADARAASSMLAYVPPAYVADDPEVRAGIKAAANHFRSNGSLPTEIVENVYRRINVLQYENTGIVSLPAAETVETDDVETVETIERA